MTIGIIGSGAIGSAFARTLAGAGIEATISNSRGPDSLKGLVSELGPSIKAGTREESARAATQKTARRMGISRNVGLEDQLGNLRNWIVAKAVYGRFVNHKQNPETRPAYPGRGERVCISTIVLSQRF